MPVIEMKLTRSASVTVRPTVRNRYPTSSSSQANPSPTSSATRRSSPRPILRADKEHPAVEEPMEIRPQNEAVFDALFAAFLHRPKVRCIQHCPRRLLADYTPSVLVQNVVSESTFPVPLFSVNPQSWSAYDLPSSLIVLVRFFTRPQRLTCFRVSPDNNPVFSKAILISIPFDISQEVPVVLLVLCVLDHNFKVTIISLFERAFHLSIDEYFLIRKPLFRFLQILDLIRVQMVRIDIQMFRLFPTFRVFPPYDDRQFLLLR